MKIPIIENVVSSNGRTPVENQFVISIGENLIFQSYNEIIAVVNDSKREIVIGQNWYNLRPTTQKYLKTFFKHYAFLPELANAKALEKCVDDGEYVEIHVNCVEKYKVKYDPELRWRRGK